MKKNFSSSNWWSLLWFVFGVTFFVLATISAIHNETDKSIACIGVCIACHARCEVKILQKKFEEMQGECE